MAPYDPGQVDNKAKTDHNGVANAGVAACHMFVRTVQSMHSSERFVNIFCCKFNVIYCNTGQQQLPVLLSQVALLYEYLLSKTQTPSNLEDALMHKHSFLVLLSREVKITKQTCLLKQAPLFNNQVNNLCI